MNDVCSTLMQKPKISSFFLLLFHMIERKVYLSEMLLRADIHVFFFSSLWGYRHDQRSFLCAGEKILIKVQKCTGSHALSTWFLITLLDMLTGKRRGTGAHFNLRSNLFNWHQLRICAETYVKSCEKKNRFSQLDSPAAQTHYCRCEGLSWQELT